MTLWPTASLMSIAQSLKVTAITNTGMASTKNEASVVTRSDVRYCLMAPQAPTRTPPMDPRMVAISSRRVLTPTRRPNSSLTSPPVTVRPRSPWATPFAQWAKRTTTGVSGLRL